MFLIGGTLLTRSMDQKDRTNKVAVTENTGNTVSDTDGEEDLFIAVNEAAEEAETDMAEPMAAAVRPNEAVAAMGAKAAGQANAAMDAAMDTAMEEAPAEDAGAEKAAEKTAEEPAAETAGEQPEAAEEPVQESEFVSFLKDLGIFTLKALAAAAAIAAVVFGVKAFRKARKK